MDWQGFPMPERDNGWGMHLSPSMAQPYDGDFHNRWGYDQNYQWALTLRQKYGIRWIKVLGDGGERSLAFCEALVRAGLMVIVRIMEVSPHPGFTVGTDTVRKYVEIGVVYFEFGNEPDLPFEWGLGDVGGKMAGNDVLNALCQQIKRNVDAIAAGRGIALLPAMTTGSVTDVEGDVVCYANVLRWFKENDWEWFKGHCDAKHIALAVHNRFGNHVIVYADGTVDFDYPNDPIHQEGQPLSVEDAAHFGIIEWVRNLINEWRQEDKKPGSTLRDDSTCFRSYELLDDLVNEYLGYSLPIFGTEAGPECGDDWDRRYLPITPELHAAISKEIFARFNPEHPNAWRPALRCQCLWVWALWGHGSFLASAWKDNSIWGADYPDRDLPAVLALEEMAAKANFVRDTGIPVPLPTPVPAPGPAPAPAPLGSGKLGFQVLAWTPGVLEYCLRARPTQFKTLDPNADALRRLKAEIPDCFVDYRQFVQDQGRYLVDPIKGAQAWADMVLKAIDKARPYVDAVEGPNETGLWNLADDYNLFTAEYARIMHQEGLKVVAYNFPVGNPSGYYIGDGNRYPDEFREGLRAYWAHYLDGLRESDFLGLHEYGAPTLQSGASWLCLRYRRVWEILPDDCKRPILITECGYDGGIIGRPAGECGWRTNGLSEEEYLAQLRWYAGEIAKDSYVQGAHIFQIGAVDSQWETFSILNCEAIAEFIGSQPKETPKEEPKMAQRLSERYPEQAKVFEAGGGSVEASFERWLKATGQIPLDEGDVEKFVKQTQAQVGEIATITALAETKKA